ncbi:sensor histidine kinase [Desertibacillus haloalkaliphilus]|uniref:sensor histidine kinase n=1 Tax=Desertibacillus haloalkaliphilus TaxID=1328930 RepID=UPI001C27AB90|nr:ATP-binding protein [Desertibacillus haloalkaliphilus]MBU8908733.1 HAMP domain-containing protein [Desertibacillus haloalkaliphilus]
MRLTLRSKILFYLLIVSLCGVFLTSFSILWGFENHFDDYLQKNREESSGLIEDVAIQSYKETGELVDDQLVHVMHQQAMTDHLFYRIYNVSGQPVADTTMMLGMHGNRGMQSGDDQAMDYESNSYQLTLDGGNIGTLEVYYPKEMIGEDVAFLDTIKKNIYLAIIVTVILAFLFSMYFSRRLTNGFQKFSKAIQELQGHNWRTRVPVQEVADELKPLGESFNQLAESLAKEESLRKQFTADFAHEIRTPLATLRSQLEAYLDGVFEPTTKRLHQSHNELMRLVRLVNELEALIAAENPQIKLNKTQLNMRKLFLFIEEQFQPAFHEKGVQFTIEMPKDDEWLTADHDRVVQMLTNIINNALQYTPSGNEVLIKAVNADDYLGFSIEDEGSGIAEEDLPYLFERFYRGDKSRDRKTGGIGIGLSIVKALIDAHEGKIQIDSKVDVGTKVTVVFPKDKS